jgi:predicted neutral ceramidase superfamily lipid hydrolase
MKKNRLVNQIIIVVTTLVVGLFNTLLIRPEDVGTWRNYVGYAFLIIALVNIVIMFLIIRKKAKNE